MSLHFSYTSAEGYGSGIKILLYGASGCGKTHSMGSFPDGQLLLLSTERKLLTLKDRNIPIIVINNLRDLEQAVAFVENPNNIMQFSALGFDSLTEIADKILTDLKSRHKDERKAYDKLSDKLIDLIRRLLAIKKHLIVVAKQDYIDTGLNGVKFGANVPGKRFKIRLPYYFDLVLVARTGKDANNNDLFYIQTRADNQYDAKGLQNLDAAEPADLLFIINKILGV